MAAKAAPRVWDPKRCYIGFAQEGTHINVQDGNFFDEAGALLAEKEVPAWVREQIRRMGGLRPVGQAAARRAYLCPFCSLELAAGRELIEHLRDEHRAVLPVAPTRPVAAAPVPAEQDPDARVEEYDGDGDFPPEGEPEEGDGDSGGAEKPRRGRPRSKR